MKLLGIRLFALVGFVFLIAPLTYAAWIQSPINGHSYALTSTESSWQAAETEAQAYGGHLVTIRNANENDWLFQTFGETHRWIGLYQLPNAPEPDGGWVWLNGDPVSFLNWAPGEPNNAGGSEQWALMLGQGISAGRWNDHDPFTLSLRGIIEVPSMGGIVSNVRAWQRAGTNVVDIYYDLAASASVLLQISTNGGASYDLPTGSVSGDFGAGVPKGVNHAVAWYAGQDFAGQYLSQCRIRIMADTSATTGMVLIPGGSFTMGNCMSASEGDSSELPLHTVWVSTFHIDRYPVTKALWDQVYQWATNHGYGFDNPGAGKGPSHPAHSMRWYDAVKWCNARSEKEGRRPAYFTSPAQTNVYRIGRLDVQNGWVDWNGGYRLPTEAEWEKAARGGARGHRFPWADTDAATHSRANYYSTSLDLYDISPTRGYHPMFNDGVFPYTNPVEYFPANSYGLYDMAGNVWAWCWDWWSGTYYSTSEGVDPRGPVSGSFRTRRGGSWSGPVHGCRTAVRDISDGPLSANYAVGFRTVLAPGGVAGASISLAQSKVFPLNSRETMLGLVAARVLFNGTPLPGATIVVEGTGLVATSSVAGLCLVSNVPAGSGYVVVAAKCGYGSVRLANVAVGTGSNFIGNISLSAIDGPYRLMALVPEVNPINTVVEEGGTGYRYYILTAVDGRTPVSCGSISVRVMGSTNIPQSAEVSESWAGRVEGIPDLDGIVRLAIPASALMPLNEKRTLEVLESGVVRTTFCAVAVSRSYDYVWKHKLGGGLSGKLAGVKLGAKIASESEIRQQLSDGTATNEIISRIREFEIRAGVELGGGVELSTVVQAPKLGGGGFGVIEGEMAFQFSPTTTDAGENFMKLYVAQGDLWSIAAGPAITCYELGRNVYEPMFVNGHLDSAGVELRLGGYVEGEVGVRLFPGSNVGLNVGADLSAEAAVLWAAGFEDKKPRLTSWTAAGVAYASDANLSAQVRLGKNFSLGPFLQAGADGETRATLRMDGNGSPITVEFGQRSFCYFGHGLGGRWKKHDSALGIGADVLEYTDSYSFVLPTNTVFSQLSATAPLWAAIRGSGQGKVGLASPVALLASIFQTAYNNGSPVDYRSAMFLAKKQEAGLDFEIGDYVTEGVGVAIEGRLERGAEAIVESGKVWNYKRMPLESHPSLTAADLPSTEVVEKELEWAAYAARPVAQALHQMVQKVGQVGDTVFKAGDAVGNATLRIGQGALAAGVQVVSGWTKGSAGSGGPTKQDLQPVDKLVYGVGGLYRFACTNRLTSAVTLAISYSDADVAGLNEADLRMYYLPDGTNRWQYVGSSVDTVSNIVTATITNLGTYAVAPPLPTGDLQFTLSTTTLRADGISQ